MAPVETGRNRDEWGNQRGESAYCTHPPYQVLSMIASLLRLVALRPFLGMAILGVPVLVLIVLGLMTVVAFKVIAALIIPVSVVLLAIWLFRRMKRA
jgi:antibiotic biosynthesis monooxygenase (ABM) superfamily enzyme